jgi:hypothetical protein
MPLHENLFDECVPRPLRKLLLSLETHTAQELGWGRLKNGILIEKAEQAGFDVFLTADQNLKYQQNLRTRRIALLVLSTNFWPTIRLHHKLIAETLNNLQAGEYRELILEPLA